MAHDSDFLLLSRMMELSKDAHGVQLDARALAVGTVHDVSIDGTVLVSLGGDRARSLQCILLHPIGSSAKTPPIQSSVFIWVDSPGDRGVILGCLEPAEVEPSEPSITDELLIEARESLTLRVGDSSITIRADGKILIKGKDLVSHAKNVNRIKGGAVAIN